MNPIMWTLMIHGGAGPRRGFNPEAETPVIGAALTAGKHILGEGGAALDAVQAAIRVLEDSAAFIAGRGACPNEVGEWELDAVLCDGAARRAGGVAALQGFFPPVGVARAVLEDTPNVLLAGRGADRFAARKGFEAIAEPAQFFQCASRQKGSPDDLIHGTVGAVARDKRGHLAAATSTGGLIGKRAGRVGDSPLVGAGTWADDRVAVSCTGQGEFFMRAAAAHQLAMRLRLTPVSLAEALTAVIDDVEGLGGEGGIIAVDVDGGAGYRFNAEAMRVGRADSTGLFQVQAA